MTSLVLAIDTSKNYLKTDTGTSTIQTLTETTTSSDDSISIKEESYGDRVFEVDAFCNLDCGKDGGSCFMERQLETGDIKKRCLCQLGKTGQACATGNSFFPFKKPTIPNPKKNFSHN